MDSRNVCAIMDKRLFVGDWENIVGKDLGVSLKTPFFINELFLIGFKRVSNSLFGVFRDALKTMIGFIMWICYVCRGI